MYKAKFIFLFSAGLILALSFSSQAQVRHLSVGSDTGMRYSIAQNEKEADTTKGGIAPGISLSTTLAMDVIGVISGGVAQKAAFVENWHVNMSVNPKPILGWENSLLYFSTLQNNGGAPSEYIGDVQIASNIEAVKTVRIYEAWIQQNMMDNGVSVLAGVYDINSEFDVMQSAQLFLNSSQGIGADFASSGFSGPSTFPATGLAARIKILPYRNLYAQFAVVDGTPGQEQVQWNYGDEGLLAMAEVGVLIKIGGSPERFSSTADRGDHISRAVDPLYDIKLAIGGWGYNRNYAARRYGANVASYKNETGIYLLADSQTLSWIDSRLSNLSWHARAGVANDDLSRFRYYVGSGITMGGLIGVQPAKTGLGVSITDNSSLYERQLIPKSEPEIAWELTQEIPIAKWLILQPDVQYIINPGATARLANAWVAGLRMAITL